MTKISEIYKCKVCTNVVEVLHEGEGELVCCSNPMDLLPENIADATNPHFAIIENSDEITKKVKFNHVMTHEHHIELIEAVSNDGKYLKRKYLQETEPAEMTFKCNCDRGFYIRLYCNKDNVWVTKIN